jgi:hypothetical protein
MARKRKNKNTVMSQVVLMAMWRMWVTRWRRGPASYILRYSRHS